MKLLPVAFVIFGLAIAPVTARPGPPPPPMMVDPLPAVGMTFRASVTCPSGERKVELFNDAGTTRVLSLSSGRVRAKRPEIDAINARLTRMALLGPILLECADDGLVLTLTQHGMVQNRELRRVTIFWTPTNGPKFTIEDELGPHG